ncbi:MAG TPA: hypothetical protein GX528_00680, partial [Firmicutes bacterium]|nr:hypothetical protein [Bacillota bacterium]
SAAKRMLQGFLAPQIPAQLQNSKNRLLHLTFIDRKAHQPIISRLIRSCEVDVNILFGRIDHMKTTPFGMLLVELAGTEEQMDSSVEFLKNNKVEVEVLG